MQTPPTMPVEASEYTHATPSTLPVGASDSTYVPTPSGSEAVSDFENSTKVPQMMKTDYTVNLNAEYIQKKCHSDKNLIEFLWN